MMVIIASCSKFVIYTVNGSRFTLKIESQVLQLQWKNSFNYKLGRSLEFIIIIVFKSTAVKVNITGK